MGEDICSSLAAHPSQEEEVQVQGLGIFGIFCHLKTATLGLLCGNGFLFQVMVNQYYVVYRNILQSILPAVIVLFIGDHY